MAGRVSPGGTAVAINLDLSLVEVRAPNLELRKADIIAGPVEHASFDLVTARAVLHHVADAQAAIVNMVAGLKAGGALLLIEPDFQYCRTCRGACVLGRLAVVVSRTGKLISRWADTCASATAAWPNKHQWHSGNRGLQRRFVVGGLLG